MSEVIGLLFAILIATVMIPKLSSYSQDANDNTRMAATAEQHKVFIDASTQYIKQYSANLQAQATATTPAVVTVPMLQSVKLLNGAFNSVNPYGQTWQTQVLQPSAGNLQALVVSTGGTTMNDKTASKIAGLVGQAGGLVPKNDSGIYPGGAANAYGSFSGWVLPTANYTSVSGGHLAALISFNNGQLSSNYLYRNAVAGQPQLNRMGTDLDLNSNDLNNVATINTNLANATNIKSTKIDTGTLDATGSITSGARVSAKEYLQVKGTVVEGTACPSNDLLARDSNGLILSCQSGAWGKQWGNQMLRVDAVTLSCSEEQYNGVTSLATCPMGYQVTGGGYKIARWNPTIGAASSNAPDSSFPENNGWGVIAGAKTASSCFAAYAICIR